MKKRCVIFALALVLSGCAAQTTFETVGDVYSPLTPAASQISLTLSSDAALMTQSTDRNQKLYFCEGYTVSIQTLAGGDLNATVRAVTGYDPQKIDLMAYDAGNARRYDCAWTCAGEGGDQSCRASILDDGNYHYVLMTMAQADTAGDYREDWNRLFSSFSLVYTD